MYKQKRKKNKLKSGICDHSSGIQSKTWEWGGNERLKIKRWKMLNGRITNFTKYCEFLQIC